MSSERISSASPTERISSASPTERSAAKKIQRAFRTRRRINKRNNSRKDSIMYSAAVVSRGPNEGKSKGE